MTVANETYITLLDEVLNYGHEIETRNHKTKSNCFLDIIRFYATPLVTVRRTAWKKAIREMEWFLSWDSKCPEELLDWWENQLNSDGILLDAYPTQFRRSTYLNSIGDLEQFDQINFILEGLKNNPNSRRLVISLWNPGEMACITETNNNPNTPTVCHSVLMQFFVRNGKLYINSYQRSADMLLGVPHNWIQSWAMLLYFAYHSGLEVGGLSWIFGDAHIYMEDSHLEAANAIINSEPVETNVALRYEPKDIEYDSNQVPIFKTSDFYIMGEIPEPIVKIRPKLL